MRLCLVAVLLGGFLTVAGGSASAAAGITYGTDGRGNPQTSDCTAFVNPGGSINNAIAGAGTLIENNYCLRVSRQCLIAQNNSAGRYAIRDITFRNNVCETYYDSQGINLGSMSGMVIDNNLVISGFRFQIVNLDVLVRVESRATTSRRAGSSTGEHFSNNLELLNPNDFTAYRDYVAARNVIDNGSDILHSTTDIDGNPRVAGRAVDRGPF